MKIVIITPILYDEKSPYNHLFKDMLEGWLNAGHEIVRIVACESLAENSYKMGIDSEHITYIPVVRKRAKKSNIIVRYLRDTITNIRMAKQLRKIQQADLLFEDVSYSSYWSVRKAKKKKMKVVAMLQDVWPDNAVASGLIGNKGIIYKFFECWQKKVYKKADKLICISDDMKKFIESKGVSGSKISVIYNWGYTDELVDIKWNENEFVKKYNLSKDVFYAVYAGNIGRMQNVELVVNAAKELKDKKDIHFLIIGEGVNKDIIEKFIKENDLNNVSLLPMQPSSLATSIYSAANVNIVPLVEGGIKTALPSKTGVVLSCGKPTIFCYGSECEFTKVVENYQGLFSADCNDQMVLANEILQIYNDKVSESIGARELFIKLFIRSENIKKYISVLDE